MEGGVYWRAVFITLGSINTVTHAPPSFLLNSGNGVYHLVKLPTDTTIRSSWACGSSVDVDGIHGGEIHCLKAGGWLLMHMKPSLWRLPSVQSFSSEADDEDPFADIGYRERRA